MSEMKTAQGVINIRADTAEEKISELEDMRACVGGIFEEIIAEKFPNMMKTINSQI